MAQRQQQQSEFFKTHWQTRFCGGGALRKTRRGRKARPLSTKDSVHLIFKATEPGFRKLKNFAIVNEVVKKYSKRFHIKIENWSIQHDHIHLSIRATKRAQYQHFFRVVAGQIAQQTKHLRTTKDAFWSERPYTRVVRGRQAWTIVQDYIQLNEKEVAGEIPYRSSRLRGLNEEEWESLWH